MLRLAAACVVAAMLCSGCILTKEDIDCWYDDVCFSLTDGPAKAEPADAPALTGHARR
jgi:hypothetical protein